MTQVAEKLRNIGVDPIVPLPMCAEAVGASAQLLRALARKGELEIIRVSERRCGIRRSVLDRFIESRKSAVSTVKGKAPPQLAKAEREASADV